MTATTLSDPQRRLLATIGQRLPAERIRELYLFAPIRQGGVETGLAVVAAGEPEPAAPSPTPAEAEAAAPLGVGAATVALEPTPADAPACTPQEPEVARAAVLAAEAAAAARLADEACDPTDAAAGAPPGNGTEEGADEGAADGAGDEGGRRDVGDGADPSPPPAAAAPARFTVYTARYRLQLKGPDRGKWEVEVVEEADAPLLTVDVVVRGVQRRAGESTEVERLTGAELLQLLTTGP